MIDTFSLADRDASPVIVGIGASAGGLEALQLFLENLPEQQNLAIVIVQHLDPDQDSLMKELLARRTKVPIKMAEDGMEVERGNIYLIAPGHILTVVGDHLQTRDFSLPRGRRRPIDDFFLSLARNSRERAVGVILSGTGSDGTSGAQAIKEHGGLVFAQALSEAKYDGMPRSVIEAGIADFKLSARDMFSVLNDYFDCRGGIEPDELSDREFIDRTMQHVRYRTGHDFSGYKSGTLLRRIAVRMAVLGVTKPADYLKILIGDPDEAERLFRDVLINVTRFFRDQPVFDEMRDRIIPGLLDGKTSRDEVRIWVPGCSTGQEAYSIAMLFMEAMERLDVSPNILIFGTDISEAALAVARRGSYLNTVADEIPADLLHKYFKWRSEGYTVSDRLRSMVRFSSQSITRDPPFSQIDMITCRNVLIYFDTDLQEKAINVFHYSLREGGILILGTSETTSATINKFEDISRQNRIYRRRPGRAARLDLVPSNDDGHVLAMSTNLKSKGSPFTDPLLELLDPAYIAVSETGDLVFASDQAMGYLQLSGGRPQLDVLKLVKPELVPALRRLLGKSLTADDSVSQDFSGELDGEHCNLSMRRKKLEDGQDLILFIDTTGAESTHNGTTELTNVDDSSASYIRELESDLDDARHKVRTTVEELETSNEELKSSNEEMMSMNEELQSANEELTTTNDELNVKIAEVRDANSDMENLIRSSKVGTIFLDPDLKLRNFTPEARNLFRFKEADLGRPIDDIGSDLDMRKLVEDLRTAMDQRSMLETEYESSDGRFHRARLIPYSEHKDTSGGVVVSFFDVTELRQLARDAEAARQVADRRQKEIEEFYDSSPIAMALISPDLIYLRANQKFADLAGVDRQIVVGKSLGHLSKGIAAQMHDVAHDVLRSGNRVENLQLKGSTLTASERVWETDWFPIYHDGKIIGIGLNVRDVTEQVQMQFELRRVMQELQHRVKNMLANVLALVSRAGRDVTTDKAIFDSLAQRIQALAQTHKLLTQTNWTSARLQQILRPELIDVYGEERVQLKGPDITVNSRAALSLGMAIHELATNAAKYGSFSVSEGGVSLSWLRQDDGEADAFIFTWREYGGPDAGKSDRSGFGSQLIRSTLERSLNGKVDFQWEPEGLTCVFSIPSKSLIEIPNESVFDTFST